VETLSREDLAARLTLTADAASIGPLLLSDSFITIMDTNDYCAIPQPLKDQLSERYPEARRAHLKTGGDFPFLSRPDEVNLHLQLHLRRVGVEARPELVRGANLVTAVSPRNNLREATEDTAKDDQERPVRTTDNVREGEASEGQRNEGGEISLNVGDKNDASEDLDDLFEDGGQRSVATDPGATETHHSEEKRVNPDQEQKQTKPELLEML
ncbi:hypothetical protein CRG98_020079, partial [Punica granatum]